MPRHARALSLRELRMFGVPMLRRIAGLLHRSDEFSSIKSQTRRDRPGHFLASGRTRTRRKIESGWRGLVEPDEQPFTSRFFVGGSAFCRSGPLRQFTSREPMFERVRLQQ